MNGRCQPGSAQAMREALEKALTAMHIASCFEAVSAEYDFTYAIEAVRAALSGGEAVGPREPIELWALLYLHDWDPPKEGQEHKWEPGKNVFPEISALYRTLSEATKAQADKNNPVKYWISRVRLAALPSEAIGREWQPIETAPPAGTNIDVWMVLPSGYAARWTGVMWGEQAQHWIGGPPSQDEKGWKATHWMPLPAGPVVTRPHQQSPGEK